MSGVILIYSCQKYKQTRIRELAKLASSYANWKVFFFVGDPHIPSEYELDGNLITLKCEDSYLHLLKKTILGFKVALQLVPTAQGILKCGDDIEFNEDELVRFLRMEPKYDYMGIQGGPYVPLRSSHKDTWIVDYYKRHPEDFENPYHGLPSWETVSKLTTVPTIQAASGPLTYFSRKSSDILIEHMESIDWDILREVPPYGYPYIIEEPGISFILYPRGIRPTQYVTFTESRNLFGSKPFIGLHTNAYKWEGPKKVCIVGAGWYGCHAALLLRAHGFYVHLLDKEGIFSGASSKNQNRLHLGYHYPRSSETIRECQEGYSKFLAAYECYTIPLEKNYYLFHEGSKTSVDDYRKVFSNGSHTEKTLDCLGMKTHHLSDRVFAVQERVINNQSVKTYMQQELLPYLEVCASPTVTWSEEKIFVNEVEYDFVLNCTNNQYIPIPVLPQPTYETFCSYLYEIDIDDPIGLTVMDGPFFSIYPYDIENRMYTVTHVVHGVVGSESAKQRVESEIFQVFPELQSKMKYKGYFLSQKTKYDYIQDDRSLRWGSKGNYFSFSGGKITGIFEMEKVLRERVLCS